MLLFYRKFSNSIIAEHQDISPSNAQGNPTSKLYLATRPTRLRRISSSKKKTNKKRDFIENILEKEISITDSDSNNEEEDFSQSN